LVCSKWKTAIFVIATNDDVTESMMFFYVESGVGELSFYKLMME